MKFFVPRQGFFRDASLEDAAMALRWEMLDNNRRAKASQRTLCCDQGSSLTTAVQKYHNMQE